MVEHMSPLRRSSLSALFAATVASTLLVASPASAAYAKPVAKTDAIKINTNKVRILDVKKNDRITNKAAAKVAIISRGGLRVSVKDKKLRIVAPKSLATTTTHIRYRVTDSRGNKSAAWVRVDVNNPASLTNRINKLPVATEKRDGYDRDLFKHWIDADKNGCDTRREVLIAEATSKPKVGSGCSFTGGKWTSWYDGATTTNSSGFDIDHMVPLAESWDSGAWAWTNQRRQDFANDLGDYRALIAVSASSNRSKSDRDPAEWMPARAKCGYLTHWVAVKVRWGLKVDSAEKAALRNLVNRYDCTKRIVRVALVR